jgi:hypothetical protein
VSKGIEIAGIALLTRSELASVGSALRYVIPLDEGDDFSDLLAKIDEAEEHADRGRNG